MSRSCLSVAVGAFRQPINSTAVRHGQEYTRRGMVGTSYHEARDRLSGQRFASAESLAQELRVVDAAKGQVLPAIIAAAALLQLTEAYDFV